MAGNNDPIEESVVRISPDLTGFREKLDADLKKALKGVNATVKVKLVADKTGFAASVREQLAQVRINPVKVRVEADARGFNQSLRGLAKNQTVSVKTKVDRGQVDKEGRKLEEGVAATERRVLGIRVRSEEAATRATRRESAKRQAANSNVFSNLKAPQLIDFGGQGARPFTVLIGAAVALAPALISVSAAALQASTSVVALGSAGIGAALGIGALTLSFQSIVNAFKLRKSVMAQQATATENSTSTALKNAAEELRARNSLIDSQQAQLKAEKDLHDARVQAARDLEDMRQKVADLQNQQKEDTVSLAEAEANRAAVNRNFFATALDRARANQDVNNARTKLADTGAERKKAQQDLAAGVKKGVEGSDKVAQARDQLRQARERRAEVLADAKSGTAASRAAAKVSSPLAQLDQVIKDLSPAGKEMYYWLSKNEGVFKKLRSTIQQATLPGFLTFLKQVTEAPKGKNQKSTLQILAEDAGQLGGEIGKVTARAGKMTREGWFRQLFANIQGNNVAATRSLGNASLTLIKPVMQILSAASPIAVKLSKVIEHIANEFANWIDKSVKDGSLKQWFEDAWHNATTLFDIVKNLGTVLGNIFHLSLPSGGSLLEKLDGFTQRLADWSNSNKGKAEITKLFDTFRDLPYGKIRDFLVQGGIFLGAVTAARTALASPFWTFLGSFALSHPDAATGLMKAMTELMLGIAEHLSGHMGELTVLLGIIEAAKVGKLIKVGLDLPGVGALKSLLISKFAIFDKFLGGAKTATMTVQAGVVNVYGGAEGIPGATPGVAEPTSKAGKLAVTALNVVGGITVASMVVDSIMGKPGSALDELGAMVQGPKAYEAWVKAHPLGGSAPEPLMDKERRTLGNVQGDIQRYDYQPSNGDPQDDPGVTKRKYLLDYISARKAAVKAEIDQMKSTGDLTGAKKREQWELERSRGALSNLMQQYGWTAGEAMKFAKQTYGLNTNLDANEVAAGKARAAGAKVGSVMDDTGTKVGNLKLGVGDLTTQLDKITGKWTFHLEVNGEDRVFKTLNDAKAYQYALNTNSTLDEGRHLLQKDLDRNRTGKYRDGGEVQGHVRGPGTSTSDSIHAMLSNNEWVHPSSSVDYYGPSFMEAIQKRRIPREKVIKRADGGPVSNTSPFTVDISKMQIPAVFGPGTAIGDVNVGEVAEMTARAMRATDKQLIALIEAGIVESGLRNLTKAVDHDSLGFLQQRPSQGWGTPAEVTDVAHATRSFINRAKAIRHQDKLTAGQLAQAVQRSAYPDRYDQREGDAIATINRLAPFLSGFGGGSGQAMFGQWPASAAVDHGHDSGVWRKIIALVPPGLNPGRYGSLYDNRHTDNGNWSWHSDGRAVDFAGYNQDALANFFELKRPQVLELIHRTKTADYGIKRGQPHDMGHEFDLHRNHLHVAMAKGGPVRKYDTGGTLPPGYTLAFNGTGRNETVRTAKQEQALSGPIRLDRRDILALARHIAGAASPTVHMDGRQVAEITNTYTYLPAGV